MPLVKKSRGYKAFILSFSFTALLVLSGIFLGMSLRARQLIYEENITRGRALFNSIVLARKWNANYGGVYVDKKEGVTSNPYLSNPDITTVDGKVYTNKNPALMTREISELAQKEGLFNFHITSLFPINPNNKPDAFEAEALEQFNKGQKEVYGINAINNKDCFRYMAPLYVDQTCLPCHGHQGYKRGDIRGGISVSFDVEEVQKKLRNNTYLIVLFGITAVVLLLGFFYFFTLQLIRTVEKARHEIERMAITDVLTGLFNRRQLISRFDEEFERAKRLKRDLSCIMLDIDHFKLINDTHGHLMGDEVLKEVARHLDNSMRTYDIVGRYGGEEFLVVAPDTTLENTQNLAERLRDSIREPGTSSISVTVSIGVTCLKDTDKAIDDIIKRADEGLYNAKHKGRDRVEIVT